MITIELYNQLHFYGRRLPKDLRPFVLNPNFPLDQLFATITLESSLIGLDAWFQDWNLSDVRTNLKLKSCLSTTFTDFAFLASHHLIYPTKFQGTLSYCRKSTENTLDVHVHSKPFNIKFGHFANHTLTCASNLWSSVLSTDNDQIYDPSAMRNRNLEPITHFIVCNNTQEPIRFGQADTEENHLLKTQECHMYAWRSHKARLLLRICLEGGYWTWCEPFSLSPDKDSSESTVIRSIDHGSHKVSLVITLRRLKPTQVQVIVSGILSVGSLLKDHLELRVIHKLKEIDPPVPEQRSVLGSFSASPSFIVQDEKTQCVKIRLLGIGTPWSGEIPLLIDKGRKKSVLVRIPTKEKGQCLTIWCRIVEEKHGLLTRYLILFSPMYMARSLLPNPMNVVLTVPNTKNPPIQIELPGKELPVQLETLGPSDQKYQIAFKVVDTLPPSEPIPMSWGIIEQVREKQVDDQIGIDQIIREIPTFGQYDCEKRWPYIEDIPAKICWATNDQPKTDVQVNFTQYHPLCNTLCVEVNPWCLIVNQSGIGLLLKDEYNFVFNMANDSVFVPPQLNNSFYLGIADHEGEMAKSWFSPPLQLSEQEWRFHQLMPSVQGMIPKQGVVHTKILLDGQICFLTIQSKNEHGMRIIHIKPTFNITNQTGQTIRVAPLSVNRVKNKISADKIDFVSQDIFNDSDTAYRLLFWQMIGELGKNQVFDGFQHISLSTESSEWSLPLNMEDCRNLEEDKRKAVFIPKKQLVSCEDQDGGSATTDNGFANIPVILTCHQRNGQIYLVLSKDENPMLVIHNNLSASLRYGQALKNFRKSKCL